MTTSTILSSLESWVWKLLVEFVPALGADVVSTVIFGPRSKGAHEALKKASELATAGKKDEAIEALRPHITSGMGLEDEMIVISDLCALTRGKLITPPAQVVALANFLAGLSQEDRTRFRGAHTKESNHGIRYGNLVQLARLPDDASRTAFLRASGLLDRSPFEQATADLNTRATASNAATRAAIAARQARLRAPLPPRNFRQWLAGFFNINPLR